MKYFFALFFLVSFSLLAQTKTKKTEIVNTTAGEILNAQITIEAEKQDIVNIHFMGRDHQYQQINEYLTFFYGSPKDFYVFINKLKLVFNEEPDITQTINECSVTTKKMMGKKIISISEKNKSGYRLFNLKVIEKINEKFEIWANENKIEYK